MKFNQALGSGNVLVSDQVKLALDVSAIKQAACARATARGASCDRRARSDAHTTMTQAPRHRPAGALADATRLGAVELTVTDLDRSLDFYTRPDRAAGARARGAAAALGAGGEDLVVLHEPPAAPAAGPPRGALPLRAALPARARSSRAPAAASPRRGPRSTAPPTTARTRRSTCPTPTASASSSPPTARASTGPTARRRHLRPRPGSRSTSAACSRRSTGERRAAPGGRRPAVGHVHLHVGDLEAATRFYRDGLGFEVMAQMPHAAFVSAGGYHHHVGYNLWRGDGVAPGARRRGRACATGRSRLRRRGRARRGPLAPARARRRASRSATTERCSRATPPAIAVLVNNPGTGGLEDCSPHAGGQVWGGAVRAGASMSRRRPGSAGALGRCVRREAPEDRGQRRDLGVAEAVEEARAHGGEMRRLRGPRELEAGGGQLRR